MNFNIILTGLFLIYSALSAGYGNKSEKATFSAGCFWCIEYPFEQLNGVKEVISGYAGGKKDNPTYKEVASGNTGYIESIQIIFVWNGSWDNFKVRKVKTLQF